MALKLIKQASAYKVVLPEAPGIMSAHLEGVPHYPLTPSMSHGCGFIKLETHGEYVVPFAGGYAFALRYDEKIVPGSVVNEELKVWIERFKDREGYTPGRKEKRDLREQVVASLNAVALTRSKVVICYYRTKEQLLLVPTISRKLKDAITRLLVTAVESMKSTTIHVSTAKGSLTTRLMDYMASSDVDAFGVFSPGERVVLVGPNGKSSFDMTDLTDAANGVQEAVAAGGQVSELSLRLAGIDFRLTQDFLLKGVVFDVPAEPDEEIDDAAAEFEHEAAVQTLMVGNIIAELCKLFDYTPAIAADDGDDLA